MGFKEGFFWGGATAANQYEGGYLSGGKGLAIQDVITGGDGRNNIPRRMALKLADGSTKFKGLSPLSTTINQPPVFLSCTFFSPLHIFR